PPTARRRSRTCVRAMTSMAKAAKAAKKFLFAGFAFLVDSTCSAVRAQDVDTRPSMAAVRLTGGERIVVDGHLAEGAWSRAVPASGFGQLDPQNGEPATEHTEVRVAFDRDRLYFGVQCFDSEPTRLLGNQMVRDGPLGADDRFMWALDPFFNQRGGYFFEINPSGAMGDGLLVPAAGGGGGGATGLGFGVAQNRAWDGIWLARVRRH